MNDFLTMLFFISFIILSILSNNGSVFDNEKIARKGLNKYKNYYPFQELYRWYKNSNDEEFRKAIKTKMILKLLAYLALLFTALSF